MEQDKKQKLLIAILAVAGLGAGSYFYFTSASDTNPAPTISETSTRRERKKSDEPVKKDVRKEREVKTAAVPETTGRKERAARPESDTSGRRVRGKANTEINKKKKIVPAA